VLSKFVAQAMECDLSGYLEEHSYSSNTGEYLMQYGNDSKPNYGYMSRGARLALALKAMMAGDDTTGGFLSKSGIDGFVAGLDKMTKSATKAMQKAQDHTDALHDAADKVLDLVSGDGQKAGRTFSETNVKALTDHANDLHDMADAHTKAMNRHMKAITTAADDLATILQGSEAAYGTDPGTPERQEGKARSRTAPGARTRSSHDDTVTEEEAALALSRLQAIKF